MVFFFRLCYRNNPERIPWRPLAPPKGSAMKSPWSPDLTSVYRSPFTVQLLLLFLLVGRAFPLQAASPTSGFTVDISRREQSRSFYNALYPASEGVPPGWNGDLATCTAGTTSDSFKAAVLLRINYFRAMAGVPATITFSDLYSAKSQQAALMMSRNNALNRKPPTSWFCYSAAGYEAAGKSNLALGSGGPETITGSMMDYGVGNSAAGHRRWLLYPQTMFMGNGDIPGTTGYPAASSLWVTDDNYGNLRPTTREEFVAWPPSQLSLTLSGTGGGTVTSDPPGISCPHGDCVKQFPVGLPVLPVATPDSNSLFGGWTGGGCGGVGSCSVPLTSDSAVTSRFDYVQPLRVPLATPVDFSSLPLAYAAVPDGGSILARSFIFPGNLLLDKEKRLFLRGGDDTNFAGAPGISVLNGQLTLSRGSLVVSGIVIR